MNIPPEFEELYDSIWNQVIDDSKDKCSSDGHDWVIDLDTLDIYCDHCGATEE